MQGARPVRAPRGTTLTAQSWAAEAPLRMLMNNLDPENAERPDDLVVYGGTGRAARDWRSYDAMVRTLTTLKADETMLVQSGRPVGVMQTHEWAPRVILANSNLVGDWATWPEFRRLEQLGLTMYGQMTAGSWIYIGTQGIVQGTYETFAAVADKRFGGTLAGTLTLTAGCGGMGGAQPLAVTMNDGVCLIVDVDRNAAAAPRRAPLPRRGGRRPRRRRRPGAGGQGRAARVLGRRGRATRADGLPGAAASRGRDRRRHRPDLGARPAVLPARRGRRWRTGPTRRGASPTSSRTGRGRRWPATSRRWSASRTRGPRSSTTATRSATRPARAATRGRSTSRASCPPTSGRCSARDAGPFRWVALSGDPKDIHATDEAVMKLFPDDDRLQKWMRGARDKISFQGLPARICWLGYGERDRAGLAFNDLVARGVVSAPIVIGRDHLDAGSVASPYRETESMADGSDAIADWPLLNAMINTASGATWVSIHHGGGVGIGRSIHAGQVSLADGTELAGAEAGAGADERPRHGRHPPRRRRLRARRRGRRGTWRPGPDARRGLSGSGVLRSAPCGRALTDVGRRRRHGRLPALRLDRRGRRAAWRGSRGSAPRADSTWSRTASATSGRGGATRTRRPAGASSPGRTSTRCPTAARTTARSAWSARSRRSTGCASRASGRPDRLGVVNFVDEEGARFGVACSGSRVLTGALTAGAARWRCPTRTG